MILTSLIIWTFHNEIKLVNSGRPSHHLILLTLYIFCIPCTYRVWHTHTEIEPRLRSLLISCFGRCLFSRCRVLEYPGGGNTEARVCRNKNEPIILAFCCQLPPPT